jgi:CHAT domain-containing protein/Tfp pilus assembly protein PilF
MYKSLLKILSGIILLFTLSCASVPMPGSSAFSFVSSSKLTEGHNLLVKKEYEKAIAILNKAISDAMNKGNLIEAAHAHGQMGILYAEMVYYSDAEKHHREAVSLSERSGYDPSIFYAQWAITRARMWDYDNGMRYANKALDLLAERWKKPSSKVGGGNRDVIIDDVVAHPGFPPDVDAMKTVAMAESSMVFLYLIKDDNEKAVRIGERAVRHIQGMEGLIKFGSMMGRVTEGEKAEFYKGLTLSSASTSQALINLGNNKKGDEYLKIAQESFINSGYKVSEKGLTPEGFFYSFFYDPKYADEAVRLKEEYITDSRYSEDYNTAERLYQEGRHGEAIPLYKSAIEKARIKGDKEELFFAYDHLGWLTAELGRFPEAERHLKEAIKVAEKSDISPSITYGELGTIKGRMGDFEKGLEYSRKSLDSVIERRKAKYKGEFSREKIIDDAVLHPGFPPKVWLFKAITMSEGGKTSIYYLKGDYKKAIDAGEKTIKYFKDLEPMIKLAVKRERESYYQGLGWTTISVGDSCLNLGEIEKGRKILEDARVYFKRARLPFGDMIAEGLIAYSYILQGDYKNGSELSKTAFKKIEESGFEEIKWKMRYEFARVLYKEARELDREIPSLSKISDPLEGEKVKRRMLERNKPKGEALSWLLGDESSKKLLGLIETLEKTNDRDEMLSSVKSLNNILKETAYQNYMGAIEHIESIRANLETDINKRLFQTNKKDVYRDAILLALDLYGPAPALSILERAKARSFLDLLANRRLVVKDEVLSRQEMELKFKIGEIQARLYEEEKGGKEDAISSLKSELETGLGKYRDLIISIKKENPDFASLITASPLKSDEIKGLIPEDTTLLEYYIPSPFSSPTGGERQEGGDEKLLIWVINSNGINIAESPVKRDAVTEKVKVYRDMVVKFDGEGLKKASSELYDILIKPVKPYIKGKRICIVPFDALHYLPFQALWDGEKYLIEEYPIFYLPSASVMKFTSDKRRQKGERLIAFGNPDLDNPSLDLPFAQKEVEKISALYKEPSVYYRRDANEDSAKRQAVGFDIIHFASHAEFSDIDPMYSNIRLAKSDNEDGRFETAEVFSLNIKPYLVVLSACKTGLGAITSGDEIIGMNRAWIYAGTPSVISSLWSVSDISTAILMEEFYKGLKGKSKDEALRDAEISLIKSKDYSHPFYWAPFYLTGDFK